MTGPRPSRRLILAFGAALPFVPLAKAAADPTDPVLIYDYGGKFDHSFNEAAFDGAEKFRRDTGRNFREIEISSESQREQAISTMARRGASLVIGVGYGHQAAIDAAAQEYPSARFTLIDAVVDRPNVQSIVFREQEAAIWSGCWPRRPRKPASSASSAGWIFR